MAGSFARRGCHCPGAIARAQWQNGPPFTKGFAVVETGLAPLLIGRQRQVDGVRRWVAELADGQGRATLVEGEPGIGKSFLLRHAAREARAAGCQVFWAACDELSQAFPLLPLLDATASAAGHGRNQISQMLGAESAPGNRVDMVAAATERILSLVDELCARAPVMIVVDDLHWADGATVLTLGRLARSVHQLPLLVVGATRPVPRRADLAALRRAIQPGDRLRMHSLSETDVAEFLAQTAGGPPGTRLLRLAADAAGNPLYLKELIDALARADALVSQDGRVDAVGGPPPGSLSAAISDRLQFLSAPVRGALRAAALLGVDFTVSELALVSGHRVTDLLPILDEAILTGVLHDDGPELAFRHPLIRAALYEEMPAPVRAAWHRDAGKALAEGGAAPDRVARQLLPALRAHDPAAGVDDWMVNWLADVGQQLVNRAPQAAIELLRWAMGGIRAGVSPHDLLACRLADALYRVGDAKGSAQVAEVALAHVTRPDLLVDLHWTLTQCKGTAGNLNDSLAALQHAMDAPGVERKHRARLLVLTARAHRGLGHVGAAGEVAHDALALATAAGDHWATGWALSVLTIVYGTRGESSQALPLFDRALAVAESDPALSDLRLLLQINQAAALGELDRYDAAISAAEQVRRLADEAGNSVRLAQAQCVLGELLFDVGRWDDALAEVDPESCGSKDPEVECCDRGVAATIGLHRGDRRASQHIVRAKPSAARLGRRVVGTFTLARSLERERADAPAEALGVLMDGLSDSSQQVEGSADLMADAVRLAVIVNDQAAARDVVARAEAIAEASNLSHMQAVAAHCRGLFEHDPARLLRAAEHYETARRPLPRAQALEAAGVAFADGGDIASARQQFTDAFSLYADLGADWDLARTQARFRAYGIRRGPHARHRRSRHGWDSLTPTEVKVLDLVASGMSNPQIAAQLFLSRRTVQTHVSHILAKLDLHSRTEIVREASLRDRPTSGAAGAA
jgi:DNA-binding CsgD family transcriptional regulator/tetratricopeptide (TPR) repeat protein